MVTFCWFWMLCAGVRHFHVLDCFGASQKIAKLGLQLAESLHLPSREMWGEGIFWQLPLCQEDFFEGRFPRSDIRFETGCGPRCHNRVGGLPAPNTLSGATWLCLMSPSLYGCSRSSSMFLLCGALNSGLCLEACWRPGRPAACSWQVASRYTVASGHGPMHEHVPP